MEFAWGDPWVAETRFSDDDITTKFRHVTKLPTAIADAVIDLVITKKVGSSSGLSRDCPSGLNRGS